MKKVLSKVGGISIVVAVFLCGVLLVNADSSANSSYGELKKGASMSYQQIYSYNNHKGAIKPTTNPNGASGVGKVTWSYGKKSGSTFPVICSTLINGSSLNVTVWSQPCEGSYSGAGEQLFYANTYFYGNIQTLNYS